MICPSIPIPTSTELNFVHISCRKKITGRPFGAFSAGARGYAPSAPYPPLLDKQNNIALSANWIFRNMLVVKQKSVY